MQCDLEKCCKKCEWFYKWNELIGRVAVIVDVAVKVVRPSENMILYSTQVNWKFVFGIFDKRKS